MKNIFKINEEEKNHIRGLHNINEQSGFVEAQGGSDSLSKFNKRQDMGEQEVYLDPNQDVSKQVDDIVSQNHKDFMDGIHSMCGKMESMGSEGKIGGRRCDGNTSDDDTDGCYGPLIALVKQYCKIK